MPCGLIEAAMRQYLIARINNPRLLVRRLICREIATFRSLGWCLTS